MKNSVEDLIQWLQLQVKEAKVKGLVVGVSGGLDSAVIAYLIKRAFPEESLGVVMPLHSSSVDMTHANLVINDSGIKGMTIDLSDSHDVMYTEIKNQIKAKDDFKKQADRLADANLRARLRMSTLYTIATNYQYLVVGTDNASEWYTGYFTKYGDGGVDILPLVHFTKQEVREMANDLGVPEEIIHKQPSADLWEGQTDEEEMGTTYDKIDDYLKGNTIPEEDKVIIERMHRSTEHKRNLPTPFEK